MVQSATLENGMAASNTKEQNPKQGDFCFWQDGVDIPFPIPFIKYK